jgi:uncharacterized membrane protein YfcA
MIAPNTIAALLGVALLFGAKTTIQIALGLSLIWLGASAALLLAYAYLDRQPPLEVQKPLLVASIVGSVMMVSFGVLLLSLNPTDSIERTAFILIAVAVADAGVICRFSCKPSSSA